MPYIPFTDEQKLRAASVDLPAFLEQHGYELKRSGHEFHSNMRRVYAYLIQQRQIPAEIISHFAKARTLYESAEPAGDGRTVHHNAVFAASQLCRLMRRV